MTFLLACLLVGPPSFAAGWYANDLWKRFARQGADVKKLSDHILVFSVMLMAAAVIGSIVYTNVTVDDSEQRAVERNAKNVVCLSRVFEDFLTGNQELRDASAKRDDALVNSKRALRELIRLRVIEQISDSEAVRQAAAQYMVQTDNFIEASMELREARRDYRLPDFEKECGNVPAK